MFRERSSSSSHWCVLRSKLRGFREVKILHIEYNELAYCIKRTSVNATLRIRYPCAISHRDANLSGTFLNKEKVELINKSSLQFEMRFSSLSRQLKIVAMQNCIRSQNRTRKPDT